MSKRARGCEHAPKKKCEDCVRAYDRARYAKNPEKKKAAQAKRYREKPGVREKMIANACQWVADNPELARDTRLRRKYGLTLGQYHALVEFQGGFCPVCQRSLEGHSHAVDHVHDGEHAGRIRGILCLGCNNGRDITDSAERCRQKAEYLENPPAFTLWPGGP